MSLPALDDATLDDLYKWLERIPCTRHRKNYAQDFSDGVLLAEVIHNFLPRMVDLHNYAPAAASVQKRYNWTALNKRVLTKLNCQLPNHVIQHVISGKPGAIEYVLINIRVNIDRILSAPKEVQLCLLRNHNHHNSENSPVCPGSTTLQRRQRASSSHSTSRGGSVNGSYENLHSGPSGCRTPEQCMASPFHRANNSSFKAGGYLAAGSKIYDRSRSHTDTQSLSRAGRRSATPNRILGGGKMDRNGAHSAVAEELVPARLLYETNKKLLEKEEEVQVFQARITHLERLSELKDERIGDLTARLDRLSQELFHQHNLNWTGMLAATGASGGSVGNPANGTSHLPERETPSMNNLNNFNALQDAMNTRLNNLGGNGTNGIGTSVSESNGLVSAINTSGMNGRPQGMEDSTLSSPTTSIDVTSRHSPM